MSIFDTSNSTVISFGGKASRSSISKMAIEEVEKRLAKAKVSVSYKGAKKEFNTFHWGIIVQFYGMKDDERYAFNRAPKGEKQASYAYSQQAVEAAVEAIKGNPEHAVEQMKSKLKAKVKPTPGAREF